MVIDHIYRFSFDQDLDYIWMGMIGRVAFPLFAFGVAYNCLYHTKNMAGYLKRIFLLGLLSQVPYNLTLAGEINIFNIFFTLGFGLLFIYMIQRYEEDRSGKNLFELVAITLVIFALGPMMAFGLKGIFLVPLLYYWLKRRTDFLLSGMVLLFLWMLQPYGLMSIGVMATVLVLWGMTKVEFKYSFRLPRWLSYGFYPLHLLALYLVKVL